MVKLRELYDSVENPLYNEELMEKIIEAYAKSDRTNLLGSSNLYKSLVAMNQINDTSEVNLDDKEAFMVETYNQWIDNMLNLDPAHAEYLEKNRGVDVGELQQYLRSFGKVSSMDDIIRLKSNPLFKKEVNGWELNDDWHHIKSRYISAIKEDSIDAKHRLYIGCQNQDLWKLAKLFKDKCEQRHIPYYFKLGASRQRDDKMVIYAETDNLENYISALQEIAKEHPEIIQRAGRPPVLTGKIDGWIGIGDEPPKKEDGSNRSYNTLRASIFEDGIEETLFSELNEFKGKRVYYNGNTVLFNEIFIDQAAQTMIEKLSKKETLLIESGLNEFDLKNERFKEHIKSYLRVNIQKGINKLIEVKDIKTQLLRSNREGIFTIPTRQRKSISVCIDDMDSIIKRMVPILLQIDPSFIEKARSQIQDKCKQYDIDDSFCFQKGTKESFERADLAQSKSIAESEEKQKQQSPTPKVVMDKSQKTMKVSREDFVDLINPGLLTRSIELPGGNIISARRYIKDFVAPYIPGNGTFILNDGTQISAIQYIEEYILGDGQEKYKGDIARLLRENTRSNNETITVDGKNINAVDVTDFFDPELMKTRVKLPNGATISASQYIQEFVAPRIPSDGRFILKSNGLGLSINQFIEEVVLYAGQIDYNGDIDALLEDFTVGNNGMISVGIKRKISNGQGIQQVKQSIARSHVTSEEFHQSQLEMTEREEMRRLLSMDTELTSEQQQRLEQLQKKYQKEQKKPESNRPGNR